MRQIKLLLVSPCLGSYGGIEAFVLALADAIRREPDFTLKICFKKVKGFSLRPSLAAMLHDQPVMFVERAGKQLADAVRWADVIHLQNASPDVVFLAKLFGKKIVLTIHNYMPRQLNPHRLLWRMSARLADARRTAVAQDFFDRLRNQRGIVAQHFPLFAMRQQQCHGIGDQIPRGFVAGDMQHDAGGDQFVER